jgi:hypothetical protein
MNRPSGGTVPASRSGSAGRARTGTDEFSVREVLVDATSIWLSHLPAFGGAALILLAPLAALTFLPETLRFATLALFVGGELLVTGLIQAAATKAVSENQRGLRAEFLELLSESVRRAPAVLSLRVRIVIGAAGRMFLLVAPGVKYLCDAYVAVPALLAEDASMNAAFHRSVLLGKAARSRILELCCASWAVALLVVLGARFPLPSRMGDTTLAIVYLSARALERSWAAMVAAMPYRQLCDSHET